MKPCKLLLVQNPCIKRKFSVSPAREGLSPPFASHRHVSLRLVTYAVLTMEGGEHIEGAVDSSAAIESGSGPSSPLKPDTVEPSTNSTEAAEDTAPAATEAEPAAPMAPPDASIQAPKNAILRSNSAPPSMEDAKEKILPENIKEEAKLRPTTEVPEEEINVPGVGRPQQLAPSEQRTVKLVGKRV